ncbi:MAG TPA: phosphodiesterase [Bacillota bacterium]|nr:phosphodiesterase [Bacillota bacterium]
MKIGVISDTHGSLTAWRQVMADFFEDVELIIHCGDVLYHGPRNPLPEGYAPAELAQAVNAVRKPIICAKGNCDAEVDQMLLEIPLQAPFAQIMTPAWRIMVHHGHLWEESSLPSWTAPYNLIISGHTHLPGIIKKDGRFFLNPGSPALPKNQDKTPTVALIEDTAIQLCNIRTGQILQQVTM